MKRKRPVRYDQCLKEQENPPSSKSFRSNITGKLQTLLNGFVSELQNISEDKRQDVAFLFSSKCKERNCTNDTTVVKSTFPSLANSSDSSKVLENFIDSAKSRISGLLNSKTANQVSARNSLTKNSQSSKPKTITIDPLEIQINLKFQSLLFKAFDAKKIKHVKSKQRSTSENIITKKDWQDLSRMLQGFGQSTKKKPQASLAQERITRLRNGSLAICNPTVKESFPSLNTRSSLVSQRKSQNKEFQTQSVSQRNPSSLPLVIHSSNPIKKNSKLLKMDFSSDSSSSPRNPFDEGCMLLLSDAEKCPNYVELDLSPDEDEDVAVSPFFHVQQSESEDEVIVLGEKSKTYQEVTLEEDDDGQVYERVVEKVVENGQVKEKEIEELVFNCPKCNKSFRVQSLLQFHIKMHAAEGRASIALENGCPNSSSSEGESQEVSERPRNFQQRVRKEKENTKVNSKISSIKKSSREKYKKRKNKVASK